MISLIQFENMHVYVHLTQGYEAEFSGLTRKTPDENGLFKVQTHIDDNHTGYLLFNGKIPIGFMVIQTGAVHDVSEFYIVPSQRLTAAGKRLAKAVFQKHPGAWQVRQIEGAEGAKKFWRKVIGEITGNDYVEDELLDERWGRVTRQTFYISRNDGNIPGWVV